MAKFISIDGVETRRQIDKAAGKRESMKALCKEKGLTPEALNRACLLGYGTPKIITRYMQAGIPVVLSEKPVPSRLRREHSRGGAASRVASGEQISLETINPKAFETPEAKRINEIKELTIRTLEAYIEELKKI